MWYFSWSIFYCLFKKRALSFSMLKKCSVGMKKTYFLFCGFKEKKYLCEKLKDSHLSRLMEI
jgi:hypothetical protein